MTTAAAAVDGAVDAGIGGDRRLEASKTGVGRGLCANVHAVHTEQSTSVTLVYWDENDVRNEVGSDAGLA